MLSPASRPVSRRFCVAPQMDRTDRHCRSFMRLLSRQALLYTEMITTGAVLHGDRARLLDFDAAEQPVALQLGGSDPAALARSTELGARWGYAEVNLNCGCPSNRVQEARFGACLMRDPEHVAACVRAMRGAAALPITVKCRIGVDDSDEWEFLRFVETVAAAGCGTFIVHARKAWLSGLSPKENREIPPLRYDSVYRLKQALPELEVIINGGITTLDAAREHLRHVDGVMLGREAYENPYLLAQVDRQLFDAAAPAPARAEVLRQLLPYVERQLAAGVPLARMTRHILGLYRGEPGARAFRRVLSQQAARPQAGTDVILAALAATATEPSLKAAA